jgi:hypothetical protein
MPALDGGDIDAAAAAARANVETFLPYVERGVPIVALGPTCGYTIKQEWPALVGTDAAARVAAATLDAGEFLAKERAAGRLRRDFTRPQGKLGYHVPCHLRAQNVGAPFTAILQMIPETTVEPIERCSAFDGTWGMKREYYELSRKYGKKLSRALEDAEAARLVSDCPLAGLNVTEDLGITPAHPMEVLRDAYGLAPALPAAENVWPAVRKPLAGGVRRRVVQRLRLRTGGGFPRLPPFASLRRRAGGHLDGDLARDRLRQRHRDLEHAVRVLRRDLLGVGTVRHPDAALEASIAHFAVVGVLVLRLPLAADGQNVAFERDVDFLGIDAGQVGAQDEIVVLRERFHTWRPLRGRGRLLVSEGPVEERIDLSMEALEASEHRRREAPASDESVHVRFLLQSFSGSFRRAELEVSTLSSLARLRAARTPRQVLDSHGRCAP